MTAALRIAVVIPTLDEANLVGTAVSSALHARASSLRSPGARPREAADQASAAEIEIVVVDGGSRDGTVAAARAAGARVIESPPGRGRQLDTGWQAVAGEVVLFLHADSALPDRWDEMVESALRDPTVAGGAFRFGFSEPGATWRLLEWGVSLRVHLLRLPYGDQALFMRREVLERAGGVPHVEILEDLDLVRAIKQAGRLRLLPQVVRTSARRHGGRGILRTITGHALALAGFYLGVDRGWIARRVRG